ncbi:MAG: Pr6Pr family membrane protein [Aquaticitalea sp.]
MEHRSTNHKRNTLNIIGATISWFAVFGQLVLIILNRQAGVFETVIRFFSFFTILTNILVACYFIAQLFSLKILRFLKTDTSLTAITAFILVVGLVYQFVLRFIWEPSGWQMVIDELLHTMIPSYVLLYWFFYVKFSSFNPRHLLTWLLYPFLYFAFVLLRGHFSGFYPYPFIDIQELGYSKVFINFIALSAFVLMLMGILYVAARFLKKHES